MRRLPSFALLAGLLLVSCAKPAPPPASNGRSVSIDRQAECDSAVVSNDALAVRPRSLEHLSSYPMTAEVVFPLPPRGGYDLGTGRYLMIDPSGPAVVAIDNYGSERVRWGQKGSGPGDLFILPWYRPGHSVAALGDELLIFDMYRLSQFDREGHFRDLVKIADNPSALLPGASIVTLTDSTALLGVVQSRISTDTSFESRIATRFYQVHSAAPTLRSDTLPYTLASSSRYAGGFKPGGFKFYDAFTFEMGETWTVSRGGLFAVSFAEFGICRLDPLSGIVQGVARVGVERRRTTNAERIALHEQSPGMDETNPDGSNFGAEMDAHWPATTPWYMALVGGDSLVAASRSVTRTEDQVDFFDGPSYLGSVSVRRGWFLSVLAITGDSLLRLERDTATDEFAMAWYRLGPPP